MNIEGNRMNIAYLDNPRLYGSGNAIQHLHFLPFGEDWVDQRNSSWNAPYTFSGKEKDAETGYGYFGARYYDCGLSIWLSVDPLSDKYPSMSPYNYCANNPVILVDPDGRESVWHKDGKGNIIADQNDNAFTFAAFTGISPMQAIQIIPTFVQEGTVVTPNNSGGYTISYPTSTPSPLLTPQQREAAKPIPPTLPAPTYNYNPYRIPANGRCEFSPFNIEDIIGIGFLIKGVTKLSIKGAMSVTDDVLIQFGKTDEQIYHAFRHVDDLGLDRTIVKTAIQKDFAFVYKNVIEGVPYNQIIVVEGQKLQYSVWKFSNGIYNIGRIHGVK